MALQAGYLAAFAALVEELIFRGAFVLVAAVTPLAAALALVTEATGSLWPAVLAHASYIFLAGPPRPRTTRARSRATPSADRP